MQWNSSWAIQNYRRCVTFNMSANLGRPSSGHRTGKGQSSSQFPRSSTKESRQLHSSLMLVRLCSKSYMLGFSIMWTKNFQMSKLRLEKAEESEIKLPTFTGSQRKQGNSRKTSTSVSSTTLKSLSMWIITNCRKLLKRWGYWTILPVSWETTVRVKKQQLEPWMDWERSTTGLSAVSLLV